MGDRAPATFTVYNVEGAQVRLNGSPYGNTPLTLQLPRKGSNLVEVVAPGYERSTCDTSMSAGPGYVVVDALWCLSTLFGCIAFIDAGGAWNVPDHDYCSANLRPSQQTAPIIAVPAPPSL